MILTYMGLLLKLSMETITNLNLKEYYTGVTNGKI